MSSNPAATAPQYHRAPHPQAPPPHPHPQGVGRNRSIGGEVGAWGPQHHVPPHKGGGPRPLGGGGGGPQAPPRRGSGAGARRSPVPLDSQRPLQGGGRGGGGGGIRRAPGQYRGGGVNATTTTPWSDPSGSDANEAHRQSHQLKLALDRRGLVFDTEDGLCRRRDVMCQLDGVMGRWAEGLHPVGGFGGGGSSLLSLPPPGDDDAASVGDAPDDHDDDDGAEASGMGGTAARPRHPRVVLISFGSYRLGVHRRDGDIDALALCPPNCTRADFFGSLVAMLKRDERVTEMHPVPGAYTPVIKFYFSGVPIDLLFARLANGEKLRLPPPGSMPSEVFGMAVSPSPSIPPREEFQLSDADLIGLDEAGVRSLNGVRVAQTLLLTVPDLDTYRLTLRAVKEWALVRGLYSNVLGFLGGVNWAILVAWVCVRNEGAPAPVCLARFMHTFARWKWPKPVKLGHIARTPPIPGIAPLSVWDPRTNPRDAAQLMPIITPCYPSMNSAYNVGQPQLRRMTQELHRGMDIVNGVASGRNSWEDLFASRDFFRQHAHYLQVNVTARNPEDFRKWFGLCESRLRILIAGLESPEYGVQCYPFAKFYQRKTTPDEGKVDSGGGKAGGDSAAAQKHVSSFFVALRFAYGVENVDLRSCTEEFLYKVNAWEDRKWGMDLTIEHRTREHLPAFVFEEDCSEKAEKGGKQTMAQVVREAVNASSGKGAPKMRAGDPRLQRRVGDPRARLHKAAAAGGDPRSGGQLPSPHKRVRRDSPE